MFRVLHVLRSGHITLGLIVLILVVFIALPILKRQAFRGVRGASAFVPAVKPGWTPAHLREARRLLQETERKKAEAAREPASPEA